MSALAASLATWWRDPSIPAVKTLETGPQSQPVEVSTPPLLETRNQTEFFHQTTALAVELSLLCARAVLKRKPKKELQGPDNLNRLPTLNVVWHDVSELTSAISHVTLFCLSISSPLPISYHQKFYWGWIFTANFWPCTSGSEFLQHFNTSRSSVYMWDTFSFPNVTHTEFWWDLIYPLFKPVPYNWIFLQHHVKYQWRKL